VMSAPDALKKMPSSAKANSPRPTSRLYVIRVRPECLREGNIDARLENTARQLESEAAWTRLLIGRLRVPTYAQWEQEEERIQTLEEERTRTLWEELHRKKLTAPPTPPY
jgi:hypothetical protein